MADSIETDCQYYLAWQRYIDVIREEKAGARGRKLVVEPLPDKPHE